MNRWHRMSRDVARHLGRRDLVPYRTKVQWSGPAEAEIFPRLYVQDSGKTHSEIRMIGKAQPILGSMAILEIAAPSA